MGITYHTLLTMHYLPYITYHSLPTLPTLPTLPFITYITIHYLHYHSLPTLPFITYITIHYLHYHSLPRERHCEECQQQEAPAQQNERATSPQRENPAPRPVPGALGNRNVCGGCRDSCWANPGRCPRTGGRARFLPKLGNLLRLGTSGC